MLHEPDLTYMKDSQDEIYELRKRPITLFYNTIERDPITGTIIGEGPRTRQTSAVVTELSSMAPDKSMEDGIIYDEADIKIDIKIEDIADILNDITRVSYYEQDYEILSTDRKGIGIRNRAEMLGRAIV